MDGVWVVYAYDYTAYPIKAFRQDDELKARQFQGELGYGHVAFWKFDTEWDHKPEGR